MRLTGENGLLSRTAAVLKRGLDDGWFWKSIRIRQAEAEGKLVKPHRQVASVYSSISRVATHFSSVPFLLQTGDPDEPKVLDPTKDPVAKLFRSPNPAILSPSQLWELYIWQKYLFGGSFWVLTRADGSGLPNENTPPEMIFPLPMTAFEVVTDQKTGMIVTGYKLTTNTGATIDYEPWEVIPFRFLDPQSVAKGSMPPLDAAMMSVKQDHAAKRWNWSFFDRFCETSGVVTLEGTSLPEEREEIRREIKDKHGGAENAYDIAVLPLGAKFEKTQESHHDMQFENLLRFYAMEVYQVIGVNKFVVGDVEDLNRATSLTAIEMLYTNRIIPEMTFVTDVLAPHIERWTRGRAWGYFDRSGVEALQQGFNDRLDQGGKLLGMGYSANQVNQRLDLGMPEVPAEAGGDTPLIKVGYKKLEQVTGDTEDSDAFNFNLAAETISRTAGTREGVEERRAYWRAFEARGLLPFEKRMRAKLKRHFFDLQKETLANLADVVAEDVDEAVDLASVTRELKPHEIAAILYDEQASQKEIRKRLDPIFDDLFDTSLAILDDELGGLALVGETDPDLQSFLSQKKILVQRVTTTVRERIRKQLSEGIAGKETIQKITDRIRGEFKFARARSLTIARTEVAETQNSVRYITYQKEGVERHQWITAGDEEVRETHDAQDGEVVKVGAQFSNGLYHPGEVGAPPEEVINCRCTTLAVIEE